MAVRAIAFDWGHTIMDERRDAHLPPDVRPPYLMPGVKDVLPRLPHPLALWANTRESDAAGVRRWLERAGLATHFESVVTSVDAGARKPAPEFFRYALARGGWTRQEVLFVGNQLSTDIAGGTAYHIQTVWLCGAAFRSVDDRPTTVTPTYTIQSLYELPTLIQRTEELPNPVLPQHLKGRY